MITSKRAYIDFEYNKTNEARLNLVSCVVFVCGGPREGIKKFWLYNDDKQKGELIHLLFELKDTHVFVCFNGVAEGQSFFSLGLDPTKYKWIDLQNEWKMLINHNHEFQYGPQLIKGKEKITKYANKYRATEQELRDIDQSKPDKSLAAMAYKMLGKKIDTDHKDFMRRIIIANNPEQIEKYKDKILEYNESDVQVLPDLWQASIEGYKHSPGTVTMTEVLRRGRTSADIALLTAWGYPVDVQKMKNFAANVPKILSDIAEDINRQFPEHGFFVWNKARGSYTMKQKPWRDWIEAEGLEDKWLKTDKGALSLSLDAFAKHFNFRHDYPEGNVGAQALRYLKAKQSMNGFMPKKKGETIFDSLGSDGRVRAWLNPYGSQSARFQPKATSYIPLKAAWMRSMIHPPKDKVILGLDYVSEEFLISACWSEDENMYNAYTSGDVYLYFGKLAGEIPWDGTKATHKALRDKFKSTTLGISYLMAARGLAAKLTQDTGRKYTVEEAQALINKFNEAYPDYARKLTEVQNDYYYRGKNYIKLPDGWLMYGDNTNRRSVANCPIQGRGSVILRSAISKCLDAGLKVILPLHDALYFEMDESFQLDADLAANLMREAFVECFEGRGREMAEAIRLDGNVWGDSLSDGQTKTPLGLALKTQTVYIDERSASEYEKFSKYFDEVV